MLSETHIHVSGHMKRARLRHGRLQCLLMKTPRETGRMWKQDPRRPCPLRPFLCCPVNHLPETFGVCLCRRSSECGHTSWTLRREPNMFQVVTRDVHSLRNSSVVLDDIHEIPPRDESSGGAFPLTYSLALPLPLPLPPSPPSPPPSLPSLLSFSPSPPSLSLSHLHAGRMPAFSASCACTSRCSPVFMASCSSTRAAAFVGAETMLVSLPVGSHLPADLLLLLSLRRKDQSRDLMVVCFGFVALATALSRRKHTALVCCVASATAPSSS